MSSCIYFTSVIFTKIIDSICILHIQIIPDTNDWKKLLTDDPMTPSQKMRDDPPQIPIHQITGVGKFNYYL